MRTFQVGPRGLRIACVLIVGLWLGLGAGLGTGIAQTAYLVADLSPGEGGNAASNAGSLFPAGKHLFFTVSPTNAGQQTPHSVELWVTDGSAAGTQRLPDDCASFSCDPSLYDGPSFVTSLGEIAFFIEDEQLWRSDGTSKGTFPLAAVGQVGYVPFAVLERVLYFIPAPAERLWRSDGTLAGTYEVADFGPGLRGLEELVAAGKKLYFLGPDPDPLWTSDGTAQGTGPVTALRQARVDPLFAVGSKLVFLVQPPGSSSQQQLWATDGTGDGTRLLVADISVDWLSSDGTLAVFTGQVSGVAGTQLWVSDGTAAGTRPVTSGSGFSRPSQAAVLGARVVFASSDGNGPWSAPIASTGPPTNLCSGGGCGSRFVGSLSKLGTRVAFIAGDTTDGFGLWASDGTPGGTNRIKEICPGPCVALPSPEATAQVDDALFFKIADSSGSYAQIWRSDGTRAGTSRFTNQLIDLQASLTVAALGGNVFFVARDDRTSPFQSANELWVSDGTAAGTRQLTDATDPAAASPFDLTAAGDQVFFTAMTPGAGLWRSTGTAASTVKEPGFPAPSFPPPVPAFGGIVFLSAPAAGDAWQLWRSDGTAAGTLQLTAFSPPSTALAAPVVSGGLVYFLEASGGAPSLWKSDGTPAGTVELVALPPAIENVTSLAVFGTDLYLSASGSYGYSLWKSDGTAGGTVQLAQPIIASNFVALGGLIYFIGNGAVWQTDGTPAGTAPVPTGGFQLYAVRGLVAAGDALYFFSFGIAPDHNYEGLFRTDGTASGTQLLATFAADVDDPTLTSGLTPFGNGLAFAANDGVHGSELWFTDGTPSGTRMISDIWPGGVGSRPSSLLVAGGRLFFVADDGLHGSELWESDGTAAGTRLVQDIHPGPASSSPSGMTAAGGLLYFAADDGLTGRELWALPLGGPGGCQPGATALCLAGGRFKVEAFWRDFQGNSGAGQAQALTGDTGTFWFFSPDNLEVVVKVLDGRALNGHFWVFYGALSSVEYSLTVTDTATGVARRYFNPLGQLASVGDTTAFGPMGANSTGAPAEGPAAGPAVRRAAGAPAQQAAAEQVAAQAGAAEVAAALGTAVRRAGGAPAEQATAGQVAAAAVKQVPQAAVEGSGGCQPSPLRLCLNGGRFAVEARWTDFSGHSGEGTAVPLTGETGYFWFFTADNVETMLKVIDGRALNGHFWVFYGALSNVHYTLTVTDTVTGVVKTYTNPAGQFASVADTSAF